MSVADTTEITGLSTYIRSIFDDWAKERKKVLEPKWHRNEDAYNAVATGENCYWKAEEAEGWRSDTFIKLTKVKVLIAYAMVIDMLLQGGILPFTLELSPWDRVILEELPEPEQEKIEDAISDMVGLIHQQILDCNGSMELMKCVMSAAKLGETYWKSFTHKVVRKGFASQNMAPDGLQDNAGKYVRYEQQKTEITAPAFSYASAWNIFRDLETDDMQKSVGVIERDFVSAYDLRRLRGREFYLDDAIDRVIANNSNIDRSPPSYSTVSSDSLPPGQRNLDTRFKNIERLIFWGRVPVKTAEEFEKQLNEKDDFSVIEESIDEENDGNEVEIHCVIAGDEVVRFVRIEPDTRPYGRVVWEINLDDVGGIGVADNVEGIQKTLNGMVRAFEDNKKLSANVILAIKKSLLSAWDGKFKPGTCMEIAEEAKTVSDAIQQFIVQDVGDTLLAGIALMEKYADEVTMLPRIMQGQLAPKQKPDTLGEINILQANAGKYLGSVIKNFDDGLIEPVVSRFYEYNMIDPAVKRGKGNYIARPLGFSSFQDKVIRLHKLLQAINLTASNPVILKETKLKPLLTDVYKALDVDPESVFKTREEKEQEGQAQQQAQQQQMDQMFMAMMAKLKAEAEKELAILWAEHDAKMEELRLKGKQDLDKVEAESENRIVEDRLKDKPEARAA